MQVLVKPTITACVNKSREEAYWKLMKCAYEMAMEPTLAHHHFGVLVKCVKASGVSLIEQKENKRNGREFVHCIATAVRKKSALILGSVDFFSVLNELVLIRRERNGTPVYIIASVLEMEKFGDGNGNAIVKGINSLLVWSLSNVPRRLSREVGELYS